MNRTVALLLALVLPVAGVYSQEPKIVAATTKDKDSKPTDTFSPNVPQIQVIFKTTGTKKGQVWRSVWFADDVGDVAPKGTQIDEATITADIDDYIGAFSMGKPSSGWPVGQYHVDIYAGDKLATTVKFTVKAPEKKK